MYLFPAVVPQGRNQRHSAGQTLDFFLIQTRSTRAAKWLFKKVTGRTPGSGRMESSSREDGKKTRSLEVEDRKTLMAVLCNVSLSSI